MTRVLSPAGVAATAPASTAGTSPVIAQGGGRQTAPRQLSHNCERCGIEFVCDDEPEAIARWRRWLHVHDAECEGAWWE